MQTFDDDDDEDFQPIQREAPQLTRVESGAIPKAKEYLVKLTQRQAPYQPPQTFSGSKASQREEQLIALLETLKKENSSIEEHISNIENQPLKKKQEESLEELMVEELDELNKDRSNLKQQVQQISARVKKMMQDNTEVGKSIKVSTTQMNKILEARLKKLKWEEEMERAKQHEQLKDDQRRKEVQRKARNRLNTLQNTREGHKQKKAEKIQKLKEEREKENQMKAMINEYESLLLKNRRLKSNFQTAVQGHQKTIEASATKKKPKNLLKKEIQIEAQRVTELDEELEELQKIEQNLVENLGQSIQQKNTLKNKLDAIVNSKLKENEILQLLGKKAEEQGFMKYSPAKNIEESTSRSPHKKRKINARRLYDESIQREKQKRLEIESKIFLLKIHKFWKWFFKKSNFQISRDK